MSSRRLRQVFFTLYIVVAVAAFGWPGLAYAGTRLEPTVLGLPPAFAWTIAWVLATFAALVVFHKTGGGRS